MSILTKKNIISILIILLIIPITYFCSAAYINNHNNNSAMQTVINYLEYFKEGDLDKAISILPENFSDSDPKQIGHKSSLVSAQETIDSRIAKIYKVELVKEDDDISYIDVTVEFEDGNIDILNFKIKKIGSNYVKLET